ncbi:MAG: glycosyltransferase [Pseudomonadota bacterium]|nr:glycosyltransferase [Pseudomonadota bacterium]
MTERLHGSRILIYSHDTFGLGHLRRCRAIAHALVDKYKGVTVLILSGSPIIGSFDFRARVDYVRIPGVIKLRDGRYTALKLHIDLSQTLSIRESIIRHTAESFAPDIFIVDKEPLGLKGEVARTLELLRKRGVTTVLGLRDILDDEAHLKKEWAKKGALPALESLYDEIWVYGLQDFYQPLSGMGVSDSVKKKMIYTGYLRREESAGPEPLHLPPVRPFVLVTAGGGKDGTLLVDLVLQTYEQYPDLPHAALIVFGPFMNAAQRERFRKRAAALSQVSVIDFDSHLEALMKESAGVVAMGGYNTFCEILSFDKPSLLMPRTTPREEQLIRAQRADAFGLAKILEPDRASPPRLAALLRALPDQPPPSSAGIPGLLDGLDHVCERVKQLDEARGEPRQPRTAKP